jgi:hypothetical protein
MTWQCKHKAEGFKEGVKSGVRAAPPEFQGIIEPAIVLACVRLCHRISQLQLAGVTAATARRSNLNSTDQGGGNPEELAGGSRGSAYRWRLCYF